MPGGEGLRSAGRQVSGGERLNKLAAMVVRDRQGCELERGSAARHLNAQGMGGGEGETGCTREISWWAGKEGHLPWHPLSHCPS